MESRHLQHIRSRSIHYCFGYQHEGDRPKVHKWHMRQWLRCLQVLPQLSNSHMWINGVRQSILNYRWSKTYISDISLPNIIVTTNRRLSIAGISQTFMKNGGQSYTFLRDYSRTTRVMTIGSTASSSFSYVYFGDTFSSPTTSLSLSGFDSGVHKYMQMLSTTSSSKYSQLLSDSNV